MTYYSYSIHNGMKYHTSRAAAKAAAEEAITAMTATGDLYRPPEIERTTWGETTERVTSTGTVGYALKRQDRLNYEATHPQVVDGRMENANGDLVRITNIKDQDLLEHDMVLSIACIWLDVNASLTRFKQHTFTDITTFIDLLFEQYQQTRGGSEGNITFTTVDRKFKLQLAVQKKIGLGPELLVARQKLLDAVESYPESANDLKTIITGIFFPVDGQVNVAKVLELRTYKVNNALWVEGMQIIDNAIEIISSKKQIRLYRRDKVGDYEAIPLSIAAL
jgi:hypothetical protein